MTDNLIAWSLQIAALVLVATGMLGLLRVTAPRARLACWQILLATCLLLPILQTWQPRAAADSAQAVVAWPARLAAPAAPAAPAPAAWPVDFTTMTIAVLLLGTTGRLIWLGLGFARLRRLRSTSTAIALPAAIENLSARVGASATLAVSEVTDGPVTFGLRRPIILVPPSFRRMPEDLQRAVLCHELLHVRRRDWAWSVAEEVVCALLWFNPAVWWLVAQLQLSREQVVDRDVVARTGARRPYLQALLYLSTPAVPVDLTPAPPFLRRRHLSRRMRLLLTEAAMSKPRLALSLATIALLLLAAGRSAVDAFPLTTDAPVLTMDPFPRSPKVPERARAASVTANVDARPRRLTPQRTDQLPPPTLVHKVSPVYPEEARKERISGTVILESTIEADGTVSDVRAVRGHHLLARAAIDAVRQWRYEPLPQRRRYMVTVRFRFEEEAADIILPPPAPPAPPIADVPAPPAPPAPPLPPTADVPAPPALPAPPAPPVPPTADVPAPPAPPAPPVADVAAPLAPVPPPPPQKLDAAPVKKTKDVRPVYPDEARKQGIEGVVIVQATVGTDGLVIDATALKGPEALCEAAIDAVRQWEFEPPTKPVRFTVALRFALQDQEKRDPANAEAAQPLPRSIADDVRVTPIAYPEDARQAGVQGDVVLDFDVEDGRVVNLRVRSGPERLGQAGRDAVQHWRFGSASLDGAELELRFRLRDAAGAALAQPKVTATLAVDGAGVRFDLPPPPPVR